MLIDIYCEFASGTLGILVIIVIIFCFFMAISSASPINLNSNVGIF